MHGPSYIHTEVYNTTPEMRTPPLIRILKAVSRVSGIEKFHCIIIHNACTWVVPCAAHSMM